MVARWLHGVTRWLHAGVSRIVACTGSEQVEEEAAACRYPNLWPSGWRADGLTGWRMGLLVCYRKTFLAGNGVDACLHVQQCSTGVAVKTSCCGCRLVGCSGRCADRA